MFRRIARRSLRATLWVLAGLFAFLTIIAILLYVPFVQDAVRGRAERFLTTKTGARITIGHLALRFPIGITVRDVLIEDQRADTLLFAGLTRARLSATGLLRHRISLSGVQLEDVRATIEQRPDSTFNFDFIIAAFTSEPPSPAPADTTGGWDFAIGDVSLANIHLAVGLRPGGLDLKLRLGELDLDMDRLDLNAGIYHVNDLAIRNARLDLESPAGEPVPDTYPDLKNPLAGLDVRVSDVTLEDVALTVKTTNTGDSLWLAAAALEAGFNDMDLTRQRVDLDDLTAKGIRFGMLVRDTTTARDTTHADPPWLDRNDGFRFYTRDWNVTAEALDVADVQVAYHIGGIRAPSTLFDPRHLVLAGLRLEARDVALDNALAAMDLRRLEFRGGPNDERFAVGSEIRATPARIEVKDGSLEMPGITLDFSVDADPGDLSKAYREPRQVPVTADVTARMDPTDLSALFQAIGFEFPDTLRALKPMECMIHVQGTVDDPHEFALDLDGEEGSAVHLRTTGSHLTAWPRSSINVDLDRLVMGPDMRALALAFLPRGTILPQRASMVLHGSGGHGRFAAKVDLDTDLGSVKGDASVNGWTSGLPDAFKVDLAVEGVRLAQITGDTALAPLSLKLTGEGTAMNTRDRNARLEITPTALKYAGRDLSDVHLLARALGDSILAGLHVDSDPLRMELNARGSWPASGDSLRMAFWLDLSHAHLAELGVTDHELGVEGRWNGVLAFDSLWHGHARLLADGLTLADPSHRFVFDKFQARALLATDSTGFELLSDALTLDYRTNIPSDTLWARVRRASAEAVTTDTATAIHPGERTELHLELLRPELFAGLLVPDLQAIDLERFDVRYDGDRGTTQANIDIPHLLYDSLLVDGLHVDLNAVGKRLRATFHADRIEQGDLFVDRPELVATTAGPTITTVFSIGAAEEPRYRVGLELRRSTDTLTVHLQPDQLLNGRHWSADPANALHLLKERMVAVRSSLRSGQELAALETTTEGIHLRLERFDLRTLTDMIETRDSIPAAEGTVDGDLFMASAGDRLPRVDLAVKGLHLMGSEIGDLSVQAAPKGPELLHAEARLANGPNKLHMISDVGMGDRTDIVADADIDLTDLSFLEPFVSEYLFQVDGALKGSVHYRRSGEHLELDGDLALQRTHVGIRETGATYSMNDARLHMDRAGIHFDHFQVLDSLGNNFRLDGLFALEDPTAPRLDLRVRTDRFRAVSSTVGQNDMFFGELFTGLDLRLTGPVAHPACKGQLSILPGTRFSVVLPGSKVELVESKGVVVFTDELYRSDTAELATNSKAVTDSLRANLPGIDLDLSIHVNEQAEFAIVLDPTSGDQATVRGSADLVFRYSPGGELYLSGPFKIAEGGYTLEFYGLVKKRFDLVKGGTINWTGDPVRADLDISARYKSTTAPIGLIKDTSTLPEGERNRLLKPLPFEVLIHFRGSMDRPELSFTLDMDQQLRNAYPSVDQRLQELAQAANRDELDRQVFGLLVLNTFIQDEGDGGRASTSLVTTAKNNTINGLLTEQMNKLTGRFIKGVDISVGMNTYDQTSGTQVYQRTSLDYKVSKSVLNDRLSFEVGGSVEMDDQNEQNSQVSNVSNTRAAQYAILYDLTPDGRFRIRGFHENAYDLYDGEITVSGVAFMFTREFEENERARARQRSEAARREEQNDMEQQPER